MDQRAPILIDEIPPEQIAVAAEPLPRLRRVEGPWLVTDSAFAAQMALKEELLATVPQAVLGAVPGAEAAVEEAVALVSAETGVTAEGSALERLARVTQADICLLEEREGAHVLIAGALCFPSGWMLHEKLGRTMARIHVPVPPYDERINTRVERMFANLRVGDRMWRANLLHRDDYRLHRPRSEAMSAQDRHPPGPHPWLRSERQTLLRLPESGAILFSIHTSVARNPDVKIP
ncbi:heme-dependent oxidative N-demethylase family protein [Pseudoroseicyclus sp. H15]